MQNQFDPRPNGVNTATVGVPHATRDAGLRSYMLSVYNYMASGVLLFAGLTAYDTQKIKSMYSYVAGSDMMGKVVIMGALNLYLDFINMFMFLLSFMGDRR